MDSENALPAPAPSTAVPETPSFESPKEPNERPEPRRSRAGDYRNRRARRRTPYRVLAVEVVVFLAIVAVIYVATAPKPSIPTVGSQGGHAYPPQVRVQLAPVVVGSTACGAAHNYTTEKLRINSTTTPLTTQTITLTVVELADGDFIDSASTAPVVSATSVCVNTPPAGGISWYAVLVAPSGANIASFTYSQGWAPVGSAPFPGPVTNGSALSFVFAQSIAGLGYGVYIQGVEGGPLVAGLGVF
jgi:hypothetical protein